MKILKKIWFLFLFLFVLLGVFVLICAFHPDLTQQVADFLYSEQESEGDVPGALKAPEEEEADVQAPEEEERDVQAAGQSQAYVVTGITGRNGYEPIREEGQEVEEEEAQQLGERLGYGNTGDDLTFDPVFYPYYQMLDDRGKHLYRQIYANANDLNEAFAPVEEVEVNEMTDIFSAVIGDHPELFFMNTAYYCKYRRSGICVEIDLSYNRTADDLLQEQTVFWRSADEIINEALTLSDDYAREKFVHDALADRITYDLSAEMGQSAYSALVNGRTVCAGYARAFQYLMQRLGIPCYYCTGYAGENHAWDIVGLEDGFYNVDVTWDDTDSGRTYDYFNRSDSDYADTHARRDLSVNLPPCAGERYRNLEKSSQDAKRGIEELGITPDQVITSLADLLM